MATLIPFTSGQMLLDDASLGNPIWSSSKGLRLSADKAISHFIKEYWSPVGTNVVDLTIPLHIARGPGTVVGVEVTAIDTGGSTSILAVDIQKGDNDPTAFATILSSTIALIDTDNNLLVVSGTINDAAYDAGDVFQVVLAMSGTTETMQGLLVAVAFQEHPQDD